MPARTDIKVLHYSFQSNHVHLVIEASNNEVGVRKGRIQIERNPLHVLKTIREVKHALHYVLFNQQKHERGTSQTIIDAYSSLSSMERGLELIRKFAKEKRIWINVEKDKYERDHTREFLFNRGLNQLFC